MRLSNKRYELDMLNGPVMPRLLSFAVPLILSSVLQLTFNAADVIVVGQFEDKAALAAVGAPGSLINLLINLFLGFSVGANVVTARHHGAGDYRGASLAVHTSMALSLISGVLVGLFGFFMAGPLLGMMNTDEDFLPLATKYMSIYFLGMPANMMYNFGAAILRAVGDTRRPLLYLTISGFVNVLLNLLFVIVFRWSVAGVALATVIAQVISAVLVVLCLMRSDGSIHLDLKRLKVDKHMVGQIAKVGLPAGLQGTFFSISNVLIQSTVNSFKTAATAGNTTASNLEGYIYVAMNAIYQSAITFTSQNVGARRFDRISRISKASLVAVTGIGVGLGGLIVLCRDFLFRLYTQDPDVIQAATTRLVIIATTYFLCGLMDVMVGLLRGMGSSITPMIVSVMGACVFRILWITFILPMDWSLRLLYISYPASWALTFSVHLVCYFIVKKRLFMREGVLKAA